MLALAVVAAIAIAVTQLASGSGGRPSPAHHAAASGSLVGGVPLQLARCDDWLASGSEARARTIAALAYVAGGPSTTGGRGATLPSGEATAVLNRVCAAPFARGFLLYEIYNRAAAFR